MWPLARVKYAYATTHRNHWNCSRFLSIHRVQPRRGPVDLHHPGRRLSAIRPGIWLAFGEFVHVHCYDSDFGREFLYVAKTSPGPVGGASCDVGGLIGRGHLLLALIKGFSGPFHSCRPLSPWLLSSALARFSSTPHSCLQFLATTAKPLFPRDIRSLALDALAN